MRSLLVAAACAALGFVAYAVTPAQDTAQAAPKPTAAHERLADMVGTWDAVFEMSGQQTKGTETCGWICGGFWIESEFRGEVMGQPYHGKGYTGVDPAGKYTGVWVDNAGGPLTVTKNGECSKDGKILTMESEGLDMEGKPGKWKHITTWDGKDKRTYEIAQILDGGKTRTDMLIRYTRRK